MDENASQGRSQQFQSGVGSTGMSSFRTIQSGSGRAGYQRKSVLATSLPTPNGMSAADRQRSIYTGRTSALGSSQETLDKSLWLDGTPKTATYSAESKNGGY